MTTEIYKIKFGKWVNEHGVPCYSMYTIGAKGYVDGEYLTPLKITLRGDKVIVFFEELGIRHEFTRTDDVEIFRRNKNATETQDTTK